MSEFDSTQGPAASSSTLPAPTEATGSLATVASAMFAYVQPLVARTLPAVSGVAVEPVQPAPADAVIPDDTDLQADARLVTDALPPVPPVVPRPSPVVGQALLQEISFLDE